MIPVYTPFIAKNQSKYVNDCLDSNWISSRGKYITRFEKALESFIGIKHAIVCSNGSTSLILILIALGLQKKEILMPSLTYVATASSVHWAQGSLVLVDNDNNFQIDLKKLELSLSSKTKAIIVPQLYGNSCDMEQLVSLCKKNNIILIEDSAEAFGCHINSKMLGSFGKASSFSFFGNKVITTGEGGVVCTDDDNLASKIRLLRSQNHLGDFIHDGPGFNFRMTNIQAAIGLSQLEEVDKIISLKKSIANFYSKNLHTRIRKIIPYVTSSEWMPIFILPRGISYREFKSKLSELNIDSRPCFTPVHLMPGFMFSVRGSLINSESLYTRGFNLPSSPNLTKEELKYICKTVNRIIASIQ